MPDDTCSVAQEKAVTPQPPSPVPKPDRGSTSTQTFRFALASFITVLWAVGYLVAIVTSRYTGVVAATPVMLIAAAYFFTSGSSFPRRKEDNAGRDDV